MSSTESTLEEVAQRLGNDTEPPSTEDPVKQAVYEYAVPLLVLACVISTLFNSLVLISLRWLRRSINPTLSLSLSLTFADGYASFMCGLGFVINSYLPVVNQSLHQCFNLVLEALRLSGLVAAALNLLALSFNHYLGILRPLHYASTVTRRSAYIGIVFLWAVPLLLFFTYFSSVPGQGFQSGDCADLRFLRQKRFSVLLGMLFTVPLVVMTLIYLHIFFIIRQHKLGLLGQGASAPSRHVVCKKTSSSSVTTSLTSSSCIQASRRLQNVKAVYTTLLIIGTYLLGWMPAVCYYVFTCTDSCPFPITEISLRTRISMGVLVNALIVLKSLMDPFIYAARMPEISEALCRMFRCRPRTSFRHMHGPSFAGRKPRNYNSNHSVPCLPKSSLGLAVNGDNPRSDCSLAGLRAVYVGRPNAVIASQSAHSPAKASHSSNRHLPMAQCTAPNGVGGCRPGQTSPATLHGIRDAAADRARTGGEYARSLSCEDEAEIADSLSIFGDSAPNRSCSTGLDANPATDNGLDLSRKDGGGYSVRNEAPKAATSQSRSCPMKNRSMSTTVQQPTPTSPFSRGCGQHTVPGVGDGRRHGRVSDSIPGRVGKTNL